MMYAIRQTDMIYICRMNMVQMLSIFTNDMIYVNDVHDILVGTVLTAPRLYCAGRGGGDKVCIEWRLRQGTQKSDHTDLQAILSELVHRFGNLLCDCL